MSQGATLALGLAIAYGTGVVLATLQWLVLLRSRTGGRIVTLFAIPLVLYAPVAIPADQRFLRFLFACNALALSCKMFDIVHPKTTVLPPTGSYAKYIVNPSCLVYRRLEAEPSPSGAENLRRLRRGLLQLVIGLALAVVVWKAEIKVFVVDHVLKVVLFYVTSLGLFDVAIPTARLLGAKCRDPFHDIFTARSPAELWRRYNRTVGQWFEADFFSWFGGFRHPVRATLLVFLFSSIIHEYVFGIAIGKIQGWQTAFFMTQGIGVALTLRAKPKTRFSQALAIAGTIAFNLATSVLFYDALNKVCAFYAGPPLL